MDTREPGDVLRGAACALLRHRLTLEREQEASEMLAAMGVSEPTGADGLLLIAAEPEAETTAPEDLRSLPDAALYAMAAEGAP